MLSASALGADNVGWIINNILVAKRIA